MFCTFAIMLILYHSQDCNKVQTSEEIIKPVKIYGHEHLLKFLAIIYFIISE
jgi:hypothetical protein